MEAERIEVVKDWAEPKLVRDIQVFLDFANFYWQFIQGFSKIVASLTSMMKTTGSPNGSASSRNNSSRSASNRNNDSKLASGRNNGNGEVDEFGGDSVKHAKKSGKSKGQKSAKAQKLAKSQKSPKLRKSKGKKSKNLLKIGNLPNFNAKDSGPSFLTPEARSAFNCLKLVFTKALIL